MEQSGQLQSGCRRRAQLGRPAGPSAAVGHQNVTELLPAAAGLGRAEKSSRRAALNMISFARGSGCQTVSHFRQNGSLPPPPPTTTNFAQTFSWERIRFQQIPSAALGRQKLGSNLSSREKSVIWISSWLWPPGSGSKWASRGPVRPWGLVWELATIQCGHLLSPRSQLECDWPASCLFVCLAGRPSAN